MHTWAEFADDDGRGELKDDVGHEEDQDDNRLHNHLASHTLQTTTAALTYRAPTVSFNSLAML